MRVKEVVFAELGRLEKEQYWPVIPFSLFKGKSLSEIKKILDAVTVTSLSMASVQSSSSSDFPAADG